jgi:GlpG protein
MRQIGHLETEGDGRTFSDLLYVRGIENQIEPADGHGWAVWIHDEEHLEQARQLLAEFQQNPTDPEYEEQRRAAAKLRQKAARLDAAYAKKVKTSRQILSSFTGYDFGPLTLTLLCACTIIFILAYSKEYGGPDYRKFPALFISFYDKGLPEIRAGQIWRLVTPIFIHFGVPHLFFNMLWLLDLGSMIEARLGTLRLAVLVLAMATVSNLGQFIWAGPVFGGMSGVVYGLIGYIWMKGRHDPASGLFLHPSTVAMAAIWFFLCLTNYIQHVANAAHAVGLATGVAWGYLSSLRHR